LAGLLPSLVVAIFTAVITVRLSLRRFRKNVGGTERQQPACSESRRETPFAEALRDNLILNLDGLAKNVKLLGDGNRGGQRKVSNGSEYASRW
jgi:hypothetical protein